MRKEGIKSLEIAILLSAMLHIIVLYAIRSDILNISSARLQPNNYIQLTTIPPAVVKNNPGGIRKKSYNKPVVKSKQLKLVIKNQIVDIPKPLVQKTPTKKAYLSEWSQEVKKQMVSRHKGGGYGTNVLKPPELNKSLQTQSLNKKTQQGTPNPASAPSIRQGISLYPQKPAVSVRSRSKRSGVKIALNSMLPSYSRMRSIPGIGDNNYLPGLREGDVTLLNTKSFVYAGFVRRVAYRIFDQFIFDLRNSNITINEIDNINNYAYVEANMDPSGKLLSVRLLKSSGSPKWDRLAIEASKNATWDANPPKGAGDKNGIIHFIFAPGKNVLVVGLL